jgi:hypothetical protein
MEEKKGVEGGWDELAAAIKNHDRASDRRDAVPQQSPPNVPPTVIPPAPPLPQTPIAPQSTSFNCPQCGNDNTQKLSVIFYSGTSTVTNKTSADGIVFGVGGIRGVGFGGSKTTSTQQTRLAQVAAPPEEPGWFSSRVKKDSYPYRRALWEQQWYCHRCSHIFLTQPVSPPITQAAPATLSQDHYNYAYPQQPSNYAGVYRAPHTSSHQGLAITGFVLSFCLPLLGLIFSIIALSKMNTSRNDEGKGLAIAGIVISSAIGVIWLIFICSQAGGR